MRDCSELDDFERDAAELPWTARLLSAEFFDVIPNIETNPALRIFRRVHALRPKSNDNQGLLRNPYLAAIRGYETHHVDGQLIEAMLNSSLGELDAITIGVDTRSLSKLFQDERFRNPSHLDLARATFGTAGFRRLGDEPLPNLESLWLDPMEVEVRSAAVKGLASASWWKHLASFRVSSPWPRKWTTLWKVADFSHLEDLLLGVELDGKDLAALAEQPLLNLRSLRFPRLADYSLSPDELSDFVRALRSAAPKLEALSIPQLCVDDPLARELITYPALRKLTCVAGGGMSATLAAEGFEIHRWGSDIVAIKTPPSAS